MHPNPADRVAAPSSWAAMIRPTPPRLVEGGRIHTGFFQLPFREANLLDADNLGGPLARPLRWLRLKEWVGFGVTHPRLFGGILIQNAKYAGSGTVYLYDREARRRHEWLVVDLPTRVTMPPALWAGQTRCGRGASTMRFEHDLEHLRHRIVLHFAKTRRTPSLDADLVLHQDWRTVQPLVVSLPILPGHHTYTHKSPLRLEGTLALDGEEHRFDPARDLGNLDEQKTFYPYRSRWKWGCFAARSDEGREVMVNFVNQMTPEGLPGEDALWVDGRLALMEQPTLVPQGRPGAFLVTSASGRWNLRFSPEGAKAERRAYGPIAIDYAQHFGRYDGEVVDPGGGVHRVREAFGALELMSARF